MTATGVIASAASSSEYPHRFTNEQHGQEQRAHHSDAEQQQARAGAHELAVLDERGRQHRVAAVALRERERDAEDAEATNSATISGEPQPRSLRLHEPEGEAEDRARRASSCPTSRRWCRRTGRASRAPPQRERDAEHADRHVDQEDPVPARVPRPAGELDQHSPDRRAERRGARSRPPPSARGRGRAARAGTRASWSPARAARGWPAPTACTTRNAISASIDHDSAHSSEPIVKIVMPIRKNRRRPNWSASRPIDTSSTANMML